MHASHLYAPPVRRAGARGYVMKEDAPRQLIGAIREVAAGGQHFRTETFAAP
jgi:DNA-binding NarL/FixJ family response regulator